MCYHCIDNSDLKHKCMGCEKVFDSIIELMNHEKDMINYNPYFGKVKK